MVESTRTVVLVGAPNSGKTTLFNWLTGSRFRTVNYPGSTIDYAEGTLREHPSVKVFDTPGIQSLEPQSPDEQVTVDFLFSQPINLVVAVVDATQLERQLDLISQLKASGHHFILALTMNDLVSVAGWKLDLVELKRRIGAQAVLAVDGRLGGGVSEVVAAMMNTTAEASPARRPVPRTLEEIRQGQRQAEELARAVKRAANLAPSWQKRTAIWDHWLLHPALGPLAFFLLMGGLFSAIFWLAAPLMDLVDAGFGALASWVLEVHPSRLSEFLAEGVVASFGAVMVFVPQILILFFGLSVLEDSGYLARAATLIDRPLSLLGLSGRSFVPLLSGYACAVPAILAARSVRSPRERWIAVFVIPLLSCSARLPVYALLLSFLFRGQPAWVPGFTLAFIYILSAVVGGLAAGVLHQLLPRQGAETLLLQLPLYRRPKWRVASKTAWLRTKAYVYRAGPPIFVFSLLLWILTHFPTAPEGATAEAAIGVSWAGQFGQWLEPIFQPMGVDWRVGVALLSAFAAREVFVSALAVVFNLSSELSEDSLREGLLAQMQAAQFADGTPIFTNATVAGLIVFFMIALQCSSTVAVAGQEMRSWRFALGQFLALNLTAYALAVAVVQLWP